MSSDLQNAIDLVNSTYDHEMAIGTPPAESLFTALRCAVEVYRPAPRDVASDPRPGDFVETKLWVLTVDDVLEDYVIISQRPSRRRWFFVRWVLEFFFGNAVIAVGRGKWQMIVEQQAVIIRRAGEDA